MILAVHKNKINLHKIKEILMFLKIKMNTLIFKIVVTMINQRLFNKYLSINIMVAIIVIKV